MTAPELKPCPFCGGEAEIWRAHECRTAWIACMGKCVVLISKEYLSDDEAITAWNRRADIAAVQPAQVLETCGKCMGSGYGGHPDSGQLCADCNGSGGVEPQPDPRDEVIARLVEENNWQIKARAQHWLRRTISAPEDAAVEEICEKYGYGAVMDAASRLWARKPYGSGAFYVGGCIGFKSDDEARAALAAAKAVQHG